MGIYGRYLRPRLHAMALNARLTGARRERVCDGLAGEREVTKEIQVWPYNGHEGGGPVDEVAAVEFIARHLG